MAGLVHAVSDTLAARFAACSVRGELSGVTRASSGHCYFTLKDSDGQAALVRCAMFRRAATLLDFTPVDGERVELRGRLALYEPRGELQLIVESMRRQGAGSLYEQFMRLKARLEAEGLFDPAAKRPLPAFARSVGVVTSLGAAALHDVLASFARRAPHLRVIVYPSVVQGRDAPAALADAIALAAMRREVDVLLVCRGGGSLEDLWAFNDERTVRAVAGSRLPVVSGVGHETDVTLTDFAADVRATTPTSAAEIVVRATTDWHAAVDAVATRHATVLRRLLDGGAQRLDTLQWRLARPTELIRRQAQALDAMAIRLDRAARQATSSRALPIERLADRLRRAPDDAMARRHQRLEGLSARLRTLDPSRVLRRGYAWLESPAGHPVVSVNGVAVDQPLRAVLSDGRVDVRVTGVTPTR